MGLLQAPSLKACFKQTEILILMIPAWSSRSFGDLERSGLK